MSATELRPAVDLAVPTVQLALPRRPRGVLRRMAGDRSALAGAVVLLGIVLAVAAAPWLSPYDPTAVDPPHRLASPSLDHPLGTDLLGRDTLSRLLHGGRTSVAAALAAAAGITAVGLALGLAAGMKGGLVDSLLMRLVEVLEPLPLLIVAMVAVGLLGGGLGKLVVTIVLLGWTGYARVVRAATLSLRERDFVEAARAQGATTSRIMFRHVLPNLLGILTALSSIDLGRIVLVLSALSFLGFGVQPPNPEWGAMLADARASFFLAPELLMYPGVAISLFVLSVNLCGDGVRDALDGKVATR